MFREITYCTSENWSAFRYTYVTTGAFKIRIAHYPCSDATLITLYINMYIIIINLV